MACAILACAILAGAILACVTLDGSVAWNAGEGDNPYPRIGPRHYIGGVSRRQAATCRIVQPVTTRSSSLLRFFENRNLGLLWFGQTVSMAGDSIYAKALLWLMLDLTGSSGITGLVALSSYLPTLLVGVWAGVVVDRMDRRRLMMAADAARAALVVLIPVLYSFGWLGPWGLFGITFLVATGAAFFNPARDALVPMLVPDRQRLLKANAIIQSSWMFALFLGPGAALALLHWFHVRTAHLFYLDAAGYGVSMACIWAILVPRTHHEVLAKHLPIRHDLVEGLKLAAGDRRVRGLLLITAADNLFIMGPAGVGTVVFVRNVLNENINSLMLIEGCYAVGMIAGTMLLPLWQRRFNYGRILLIGMMLDGLTFVPLLLVKTLWGTALTIIIHSLAIPLLIVARPSLVQQIVPQRMQGRIFSMIGVTVIGFTALSTGLTGVVAEVVPMPTVFGVIGLGAALCGVWGWSITELREAGER